MQSKVNRNYDIIKVGKFSLWVIKMTTFDKITRERQLELARLGGQKAAEKRREKKAMRERLEMLLSMTLEKGTDEYFDNMKDAEGKNLTVQDKILLEMLKKAMNGDINAAVYVRDTSGNKPKDEKDVNVSMPVQIIEDL